ncbi:MAG: threonine ammonia-lyase [Deltaproteobacteria bacterium]|nr:threonine ammonia-lyase [Deltaproteobacteria bacterium]
MIPLVTLQDVQRANERIAGQVQRSPMPKSEPLSADLGCNVYVKLENLQRTGSFKERGACNKLACLNASERARGVIAASAGNHAQGVAYHAHRLGIPATIVMPEPSPLVKVRATKAYGAEVVLYGANYDDAFLRAKEIEKERGQIFVHAFDDPLVIAGQGTIGLEILEDLPNVDAIILAVGGGGLISGVAAAVKALRPGVEIIGVNMANIDSMRASVAKGSLVTLPAAQTIADGIAVRTVSALTLEHVQKYVDRVVTVDEEETANAILQLLEKEKTVAEGAGAAPMAALIHRDLGLKGKSVVVGICGGNINVNLIARIIERALIKDGRRTRLSVILPDRPGQLAALLDRVAKAGANVLEVHHERVSQRLSLADTEVELVLETRGFEHIQELLATLASAGLQPTQK